MVGAPHPAHAQLIEVDGLLERLDDLVHDLAQVVAALQPDALDPAGSHVVDQHAGDLGHLLLVRLDVGPRAVQALLLAREQDEADGPLGLDAHGLERPGGLEHGHDAGAVVGGAGAQVPAIDVAADDHDLVGLLGARDLGDGVVHLDGPVAEAVLQVDLDLDRPALEQPPDQAVRLGGQEGLGIRRPG